MISAQLRDAAMIVDLKALKHNIKQQQAALPAGSRILAVVKADAYGHGAVPVAHAAKEAVWPCLMRDSSLEMPVSIS